MANPGSTLRNSTLRTHSCECRRPNRMVGIKPRLASYKADSLPFTITLAPREEYLAPQNLPFVSVPLREIKGSVFTKTVRGH